MLGRKFKRLGAYMLAFCMAFGAVQFPAADVKAEENIARSATATASSQEAATVRAELVVDGDKTSRSSRWGSALSDGPEWIQLAWNEPKTIKNIVIYWERKNIKNYKVQISNDGSDWTSAQEIYSNESFPTVRDEIIALEEAVTAKFIRVTIGTIQGQGEDTSEDNYKTASMYEIEVFSGEIPDSRSEAQKIAESIREASISTDGGSLIMPTAPEGVEIRFCADYEQVIADDGTIYQPVADKVVKGVFEVVCPVSESEENGSKANSQEFSITVPGKYTAGEGANPKPAVIPELQEWHGTSGDFLANSASKIVVGGGNELSEMAGVFAEDYKTITGWDIQVVSGTKADAKMGDFYFALSADQPELGKEGYTMSIEDAVFVEAAQSTGAYWATRTILQIIKQKNGVIPKGIMRDYPKYEVRGFSFDVGRKPFTLDALYDFMKNMSWYKMNNLQMHLSDNLIFLEDYPDEETAIEEAYAGFRLESTVKGSETGKSATAEDVYYTKDEFRQFVKDSRVSGVEIIPEFDMPAHALPFTKAFTEIMSKNTLNGQKGRYRIDEIDLTDMDKAMEIVERIWNEYFEGDDPVFDEDTIIHIGTDEYHGVAGQAGIEYFREFSDRMIEFVQESGRTVRMWGSLSNKSGATPVRSKDVQLNIWNTGYANPKNMYDMGFDLINTLEGPNYIVPAAGYYNDYINASSIYNNWQPNVINDFTANPGDDQMLGGCYAIWHDSIDTRANGISQYDSFDRFYQPLSAYCAKLWGEAEDYKNASGSRDYSAFKSVADEMGTAPGTSVFGEVAHTSSTIADYSFDKTLMKDSSVNENHLTNKNNIELISTGEDTMALRLMGENSYVETPLNMIGSNAVLKMKVKKDAGATGEQILCESKDVFGINGTYSFKAAQKITGNVGFSREGYDYSFNYTLPDNKWVELEFRSGKDSVELYVDGELIDNKHYNEDGTLATTQKGQSTVVISSNNNPDIRYFNHEEIELSEKLAKEGITKVATSMIPLGRIGSNTKSFKGQIEYVKVTDAKTEIQDGSDKVAQDSMTASACSAAGTAGVEGPVTFAIDGNDNTYWHSNYGNDLEITDEHHWFKVVLDQPQEICKLTCLPRQVGVNGRITEYSIEVTKEDNSKETVVSHGEWASDASKKTAVFEPVTAKEVKIQIHAAIGDNTGVHASIAELNLHKVFQYTADELKTALAAYENYDSGLYTELSWNVFANALEAAKKMADKTDATAEEYYSSLERVQNAAEGLCEKTVESRLNEAIRSAEQLNAADYAKNGFDALQTALNTAKNLEESADDAQKVNAAKAVEEAMKALADLRVLRAAAQERPSDEFLADCTTASKTAFENAVTAVNTAIANDALTKEAAETALENLNLALRGLVDLSDLKAAINAAADLDMSDYSDGVEGFTSAKNAANTILQKADATQAEVDRAYADFCSAKEALVLSPLAQKKKELRSLIREKEELIQEEAETYTEESIQELQDALDAAKTLLEQADVTIEQLDAKIAEVQAVLLVTKVEAKKEDLQTEIAAAEQKISSGDYTESSVAELQEKVDAAKEVMEKADASLTEVEEALQALTGAQLVTKVDAKRTELQNAVNAAKEIIQNRNDYTDNSIESLEAAVDAAEKVLAKSDADLSELTKALEDLTKVEPVTKVQAAKNELAKMLQAAEDQISRPSEFDADYLDALKEIVDRVKPLLEQEDVTLESLNEAIQDLGDKLDIKEEDAARVELRNKIQELEDKLQQESELYTDESVKELEDAIKTAKAVLDKTDASAEELKEALKDLKKVQLVTKVDAKKEELRKAIDKATWLIEHPEGKDDLDLDALRESVDSAMLLLDKENATLEELESALSDLESKMQLTEEEHKRIEIEVLIQELEKLLPEEGVETDYTEESIEALKQAVASAKEWLANNKNATLKELEEKLESLKELKLVTKLEAKRIELTNAIASSEEKLSDSGKYTEDSVKKLETAIFAAKELLENGEATLEQIEAALEAILKAELVEKTNSSVKKKYSVTFHSNGGAPVAAKTNILEGTKISEPKTTRKGYLFAGWYTTSKLTVKFNFNTPIRQNYDLWAKWTPEPKKTPSAPAVPAVNRTQPYGDVLYQVTASHATNGTVKAVKLTKKGAKKITIPSTVEIDGYKFKVTAINAKVFQKASKLTSVVIGENVKNIGSKAFFNCKKLKNIKFMGAKAPKLGSKAFKGTASKKCKVVVSKKMKKSAFKKFKKELVKKGISKKASIKQK